MQAEIGIIQSWEDASRHPTALRWALVLGGVPPFIAYWIAHFDHPVRGYEDLWHPLSVVLLACMLYSVRTVFQWTRTATKDWLKPITLVVGLEGTMVFAKTWWLAILALACLVVINAIATACTIARDDARPAPRTVTTVARERNLPRVEAARELDRELEAARQPRQRVRPA
jgi:O-antigen/teichoic acid export membrane protein